MPTSDPSNEGNGGQPKKRKSKETKPPSPQDHRDSLAEAFIRSSQESQQSNEAAPEFPSKRQKLSHSSSEQTQGDMTVNEMYSFAKPNHIDLTNGSGPAAMTTMQKRPSGMARPSNASTESGPKRLVVKNLRKTPRSDPETYVNHVGAQLDAALSAIMADKKIPFSNEELYRGVENLCRQGRAPAIFKGLCEKCRQGISSQLEKPLVSKAWTLDDEALLRAVVEAWDTWNTRLVWASCLSRCCGF